MDNGASYGPGSHPTGHAADGVDGAARFDPSRIWTEDLTDQQLAMLLESGEEPFFGGYGVELRGAKWKTARSLARMGLGSIQGDPGDELPGLYFNNDEGVRILHEFDEEFDEDD